MSSSGTPTKQRKTAEHWQKIVERVRASLSSGNVHKLFEDDYFIFELIKVYFLYSKQEYSLKQIFKWQLVEVICEVCDQKYRNFVISFLSTFY